MINTFFKYAIILALGISSLASAQSPRVVSLGGDITGIIYALGAGNQLVAVDLTSIYPEAAQKLPNVGYLRQLNSEGILALKPNKIIASHDAGPPAVMQQLQNLGIEINKLPADYSVSGIINKFDRIGQLVDKPKEAGLWIKKIKQQAQSLEKRVAAMTYHPKAAFILSTSGGLIIAGQNTAADAAINLVGAKNIIDQYQGYKPLSPESLIQLKPDVILVMNIKQHAAIDLSSHPAIKLTPAGIKRHIISVPGEHLLGFGTDTLSQALILQEQLAQIEAP